MGEPRIAEVLAENLAYFMREKSVTQKALASKSGVGQTTISLYLHPDARKAGAKGTPSPVLAKVAALAEGLGVELWELLRPLTPAQRDLLKSIESLVAERAAERVTPGEARAAVAANRKRRRRAAETAEPTAKPPTPVPRPTK